MTDNDNINAQLATYLKDIGLSPGDCGGEVVFTGADPNGTAADRDFAELILQRESPIPSRCP